MLFKRVGIAPGSFYETASQIRHQRLDLVLAHGHRARQAEVVLRLHKFALRVPDTECHAITWSMIGKFGQPAWPAVSCTTNFMCSLVAHE